jgi:hypothetical protein
MHNKLQTAPDDRGFIGEKQPPALSGPGEHPMPIATQLFLPFQLLDKTLKPRPIQVSRNRRHARKWLSPCSW